MPEKQDSIPVTVLKAVPGLINLLNHRESNRVNDDSESQVTLQSNASLAISSLAATHQAKASESRLSHRVSSNSSALRQAPLHQNVSKTMALLAERKAKKIEVSAFDAKAGPKISASLWASLGESHNFKMESVWSSTSTISIC